MIAKIWRLSTTLTFIGSNKYGISNGMLTYRTMLGWIITSQEPDIIKYNGKMMSVFSNPLEKYFTSHPPRPEFQMTKTSNWRGYIATWEIDLDKKLYLTQIEGLIKGGTKVNLKLLFPNATSKVFADWVSETLVIPEGKCLKYVHMGYGSIFEHEYLLTITNGVLTHESLKDNTKIFHKIKDLDPLEPPKFDLKPPQPPK